MLANESDMVPQPRHIMVQNLHIRAGRNDEGELSASVQNLKFRPHPALSRGNAGLATTTAPPTKTRRPRPDACGGRTQAAGVAPDVTAWLPNTHPRGRVGVNLGVRPPERTPRAWNTV